MNSTVRSALLAIGACFCSVMPLSAEEFTSRDWSVSCNERVYCIARTADGSGMQLKIERGPNPFADVFVSVRAPEQTPLAERMRVDLDVLDAGHSESKEIDQVYTGNEMTFGGAADRPLVGAMRAGNRGQVTIKFGGTVGTRVYDVSLAGVTSALAEIDRLQQRDDRVDAIVLRGGTPVRDGETSASEGEVATREEPQAAPVAEPATGFAPSLYGNLVYGEADLPASVLMTGYRVFDCDFPIVLEAYGAQVTGVTDGLELWMVPCNPADVNVDYYISFAFGDESEFYEFRSNPFEDGVAGLVTNPQWTNETRQLTTWTLYSPDSDCGNQATYLYVTEDDAFDLVAYREKAECDGVYTLPEQYPLVWQAQ